MYFFQNIFFMSILCFSLNSTYSNRNLLANIREQGSYSNITVLNVTNHAILSVNLSQKSTLDSHQNVSSNLMQVASEGGGIISSTAGSHNGRENTIEHPLTKTVINKANGTNDSRSAQPQDNKSVQESVITHLDVAPQQDDEKPSVPKKGVDYRDFNRKFKSITDNVTNEINLNVSNLANTSSSIVFNKETANVISNHTSSTNTTVVHKKPLFTESDSDFVNMSKSNKEASKETVISIDQIDPLLVDKKSQRSDYIVPIVAVILSVPLVAIITSIVYKRGTDWWQHRNYKRMDFLIEGMYHN